MVRLLMIVMLIALPLNAAPITFVFDGGDNSQSTITKTVNSLTLTATNFDSPSGNIGVDGNGLATSPVFFSSSIASGFDLSFDKRVRMLSYTIGFFNALPGLLAHELSNPGGESSSDMSPVVGTHDFSVQFELATDAVARWQLCCAAADGFSTIKEITVEVVVPEPSTLIGLFCFGLYFFIRK